VCRVTGIPTATLTGFCRGFILHTSMLPSREYIPADSDVIYHYCSPESFLAICTTRRLRFSDLFSMKDFMEMHWGYHIWERAAAALLDTVGKALLDDIDAILHASGARGLILASCLSRAGDVLSQWRAYAHDCTGYAIGFKATAITQLAVRPLQVQYDTEKQIAEIKAFIAALHEIESTETEPRGQEFFKVCAHLAFDLAALKNPAFAEENEVRLVHVVNFRPSNGSMQLVDPGGTAFGKPVAPQPVGFHISRRNGQPDL